MKLARQVVSLLIVRWSLIVLGFGTGILVARTVGPEGKGILALLSAVVLLLTTIVGFGLPTAAVVLYKQGAYRIGELLAGIGAVWVGCLAVLAAIAFFGQATLVPLLLPDLSTSPKVYHWFWLGCATVPGLLLASLLNIVLVVDDRTRLYVVLNIGGQIIAIVLTLTLVLGFGIGISGVLIANVAMQCIPFGITIYWLRSHGNTGPFRVSLPVLARMFRIGLQQYVVVVAATIFKRGESLLLVALLDLRLLGFYAIALSMYDVLIDIPRALVWPLVGRLADREVAEQKAVTARVLRLQNLAMLLPVLGMALVGPTLIPLVYGAAFRASVIPFLCLLPGVLLRTMHLNVSAYFVGAGRPGPMAICVIVAAFVSLGLDLVFVPRYGLTGAATTTLVAEACLAGLSLWFFLRTTNLSWRDVLLPTRPDLRAVRAVVMPKLRQWRHKAVLS